MPETLFTDLPDYLGDPQGTMSNSVDPFHVDLIIGRYSINGSIEDERKVEYFLQNLNRISLSDLESITR